MSFYAKWEAAMENQDLDRMMELTHPEFTMVLHSTGKVIHADEWKETRGKENVSGQIRRDKNRCIYENDDIVVAH